MKKYFGYAQNWWLIGCVLLSCAFATNAQDARVPIEQLDKLASRAEQTVEVALDQRLLQMASKFLNSHDPAQAKAKEVVAGIQGIYVRVYSFDKPGEYALSDLEPIRNAVKGTGWQKIVGVRSKREGDNVDVHLRLANDRINGLVIIAAQAKELVVVNILGPIDIEKLSQLQGQFGIPKLDLETVKGKQKD
jgi:Domain of unknown function (DUF4252)